VLITRLEADSPSVLRFGFDPERLSKLRGTEIDDIAYHIARVLIGKASALIKWERHEMKADLRPWNQAPQNS
jgi:hypothetical protein